jgi:hypothetical protein
MQCEWWWASQYNLQNSSAAVEISPSDANGGIGGVDQHLSRMLAAQRRRWCNLPDDLGFTKFLGVLVQESWWKIRSS